MRGTTHAVSGTAAWLAAAPLLGAGPAEVAAGAVICAGAAVLPDIDHPDATIAKRLGVLGQFLATGVEKISGGHRKGTHTLLATALVALAAWKLPVAVLAVVMAFGAWIGTDLLLRAAGAWKVARWGLLVGAAVGVFTWLGHVAPMTAWALPLGYLLHLLGDAVTTGGIEPLFPFSRRNIGLRLFNTGATPETVLRVVLILGTGALLWFLHLEGPVMGLIDGLPSQIIVEP